jgi:hypothetical protein
VKKRTAAMALALAMAFAGATLADVGGAPYVSVDATCSDGDGVGASVDPGAGPSCPSPRQRPDNGCDHEVGQVVGGPTTRRGAGPGGCRGAPPRAGGQQHDAREPVPRPDALQALAVLGGSPAPATGPATNRAPRPPVGQEVWAAAGVVITVSSRPTDKRGGAWLIFGCRSYRDLELAPIGE